MKFMIETLVDVTQTNARKGDEGSAVKQQANFMTLYNVIGLRTNPTEFEITIETKDTSKLFGITGKHNVWTVTFVVEQVDSLTKEMLLEDFNMVPFINGLDETAQFAKNVFTTKGKNKNIVFTEIDK